MHVGVLHWTVTVKRIKQTCFAAARREKWYVINNIIDLILNITEVQPEEFTLLFKILLKALLH